MFSSKYLDEEKAREALLSRLDGAPLAEPRLIKFAAGRRTQAWTKNCLAVGLSRGFVEPLESTAIQSIQNSINNLRDLFPDRTCNPLVSDTYNRRIATNLESFRDFVMLHYKATQREDTEFWCYCRSMPVPETLATKMELFRSCGRIPIDPGERGFGPRPWLTTMYSQGITPAAYPPLVVAIDETAMRAELAKVRSGIKRTVEGMPRHEEFIARNCSAPEPAGEWERRQTALA